MPFPYEGHIRFWGPYGVQEGPVPTTPKSRTKKGPEADFLPGNV